MECSLKSSLPETPFYIAMIKFGDFEKKRYKLIPVFLQNGKIHTKIIGDKDIDYPIIYHDFDGKIIQHINQFNMTELELRGNQIPNYRFTVETMYSDTEELVYELNLFDQEEMTEIKPYSFFKTKGQEYVYALLELDGRSRMDVLGVNMLNYHSDRYANQWYDKIYTTINNDLEVPDGLKNKALLKLQDLQRNMIYDPKTYAPFKTRGEKILHACHYDGIELFRNFGLDSSDVDLSKNNDANTYRSWYAGMLDEISEFTITEKDRKLCKEKIEKVYDMLSNRIPFDFDTDKLES